MKLGRFYITLQLGVNYGVTDAIFSQHRAILLWVNTGVAAIFGQFPEESLE
jgi:hypothetical protein